MSQLQRLVVDFRNDEEIVVRCLYRSSLDGPNPTTKARAREVSELTRAGLQDTLRALAEAEGEATMCGTSASELRGMGHILERGLTERALSSEAAGIGG
jgi:hypothetical protein